ncbi:MAG: tetratricopeptide repeat protein [Candidatus Hydrogenedentes bacterium]|nr:tetratricopeptide repeat protein [Candidatus Hydrogenedentota bacterium]
MTPRWKSLLLLLLAISSAACFAPAIQNGFVAFDDDDYVYANTVVSQGLSVSGIRWAFTTGHAANYHPITWLTHMADVSVYGLRPAGHHLTNIILHSLNACLVFLALGRSTDAWGRAWIAALIFAMHPLHVESVAWVSERKDLLCALFMLSALYIYGGYVKNRSWPGYAMLLTAFALALLSKPMAVTLPFLLLVLDYWPFNRFANPALGDTLPLRVRRLLREKVPLFVLAACSSFITLIVQARGGAMNPLDHLPLGARLGNAEVAYALYLWKFVWPLHLSPIYPHQGSSLAYWKIVLACVTLVCISVIAWRARRRAPFVLAGWLWFIGMLVPVIGVVQVGYAAMADRYMYLPMTGILIAVVWGFALLYEAYATYAIRGAIIAITIFAFGVCAFLTQRQVRVWHDSESLFKHAIAVTEDNAEAYAHLGVVYLGQNRPSEAISALESATLIRPEMKQGWTSLGVAYRMVNRLPEAIEAHKRALSIDSNDAMVHSNLGYAYAQSGNIELAEEHWREALRIDPEHEPARRGLAKYGENLGF